MKLYHVVFKLSYGVKTSHFAWAESAAGAIEYASHCEGAVADAVAGETEFAEVAELPQYDSKGPGYCNPAYRRYKVTIGEHELAIDAL